MINIDNYIQSLRSMTNTTMIYHYKPSYKLGTRRYYLPLPLSFKAIFAYNKYSVNYPFDKLVTSLLENKYQDIDNEFEKMKDILQFTKKWVFKDEFVYPELQHSYLPLAGLSPMSYNYKLVITKKYALLLFKYHPKLYFRLHSLDPVFLTLGVSKEEALIGAMTEPTIRGEEHEG